MFAGDNDSIYDPRGSVYALDLSTGGNSSSRLSSYPTPPASLRLAQRQAQQHTRSQQADQALADERLKSDLPLSDPRHPANNPLHPSLSTKRKQRILHSTPNNATNGTQPASQTARRESSASTLGASDEEERLAQERMQREREMRARSMWRNERDFGWSDSAGGVRSGREGIGNEGVEEAGGSGLRRWMSVGGERRGRGNANKPYRPVFAPVTTLEDVPVPADQVPTVPYNAGSQELALGSGMTRKPSLSKRIGGALSRGLGSLRRDRSVDPERRRELAVVEEEEKKETETETATIHNESGGGLGGVVRSLSRRATTGGGRGRRRGPQPPPRAEYEVKKEPVGQPEGLGEPRERLSKAWQNVELPEIPLYKPPKAANVPNAKALSSFAPRPPLRARAQTQDGTAVTPAGAEKARYQEQEKRESRAVRSGWTKFNED